MEEGRDDDLVLAARDGDRDAFAELFRRWFDRVYDVARNVVRNNEAAADVAQDTFIAAWTGLGRLDNPAAFGGWILRIARNRALDRIRRESRHESQAGDIVTDLHDRGAPDPMGGPRSQTPDELVTAQDRDGLIAAAAVVLGERDLSLLDLTMRHGLTPAEVADELGVTPNNAHQLLFRMRKRLGDAIGAFVLWQRGRPSCQRLASLVGAGSSFDADTYQLVERHQRDCSECQDRRASMLAPEQLFSSLPLVAAPVALRDQVMAGLRAVNVPVPDASAGPAAVVPMARRRRAGAIAGATLVAAVIVLLLLLFFGREQDAPADVAPADAAVATSTSAGGDPRSGSTTTAAPSPTPGPLVAATAAPTTASTVASTTTTTSAPPTSTAPPATQPQLVTPPPTAAPPPTTAAPPPTTAAPTNPPTTTTPPKPKVVRFVVTAGPALLCNSGTPRHFEWSSFNANSGVLTVAGVDRNVPASGTYDLCASSGAAAKIFVTGPGGSTQRTLTVP